MDLYFERLAVTARPKYFSVCGIFQIKGAKDHIC